ncbi:MAG: ferredoxin--nitrite reductase, partial [Tatlockia sp.]|nr:ferredoxin--nitrite reductase [Tatlockia sp.]
MTDENATQEATEFQELTQAGESKPTLNKFEKIKAEKDGLVLKQELDYLASIGWEAMDEADRDYRLRDLGLFYRTVTPGKFMLRMRLANGIIIASQMRALAEIVQQYGDEG